MYVIKDSVIRISVRNLVEFLCRSGDIDNRTGGVSDVKVMQEGSRMHRKIQKSMGASYHAEVPLKIDIPVNIPVDIPVDKPVDNPEQTVAYTIRIEGRADGIICDWEEFEDGQKVVTSDVTIDEIKTVQSQVDKMEKPIYVHKAQAMCYGYIYAVQNQLPNVTIQLTYCNAETEQIKQFSQGYSFEEISEWFQELITSFQKWSDYVFNQRQRRKQSIQKLEFPFSYRKGQRDLIVNVYKAITREANLYIQAPTGVGKTISTVFPAVQAMGQDYADKLFYLTSKTITRTVAEDTFSILRSKGLAFRTITLTAKDKICHLERRECNPEACLYAKGHFDRVNDAIYDLITQEEVIDRDKVFAYSQKHSVCPFEMSLDASYWCDGIICDYNYVFDPNVALKRYFADSSKGNYLFLIDEAHNLVDRAREMYSAVLIKEDFLKIKKLVKDSDKKFYHSLERCNASLLEMKRQCDSFLECTLPAKLMNQLDQCFTAFQKFLENHKNHPYRDELLDFFFQIRHFLNMYDCMDEKYMVYTDYDDGGNFLLHLFCADPSENISQKLYQCTSAVFFSATLLPINYYKEMISGNSSEYAVYAESSFENDHRRIAVARDVSSRYTRRNTIEYRKICRYILEIIGAQSGKYMAFFPSYRFMEAVKQELESVCKQEGRLLCEVDLSDSGSAAKDNQANIFDWNVTQQEMDTQKLRLVVQSSYLKESEKEQFLALFEEPDKGDSLLGFCVTGGIFSEGIDLKHDSLIGVLIVGTGLPMISLERDLLKTYFDRSGKDGYSYAYVFPGMNKVLQAAGRVIRTNEDRGIIVLLDDRFLTPAYQNLYPREWDQIYPVTQSSIGTVAKEFWN